MTEQVTAAVEQANGIGTVEALVAAREQRGMTKAEVGQRLKLAPRQLDAIERGDWAALPGRAFARGAVRAYGRLLDRDVDPLLQSIGGFAEPEDLRPTATLSAPLPRGGTFGFDGESRGNLLPWVLVGVAAVVALALFFGRDGDLSEVKSWIGQGSQADAPGAPPSTGADPGQGRPGESASQGGAAGTLLLPPLLAPAPGAPGASGPSGTSAGVAAGPSSAPRAAAGTGQGAAAPAGQGGAAPAPAAARSGGDGAPGSPPLAATPADGAATASGASRRGPLRLTSMQDAWIEVRQADGRIVFSGTVKPDAPVDLAGTAPFSLVVGNASQVRVEYHGKPVELKAGSGTVARIRLP